MRPRPCCPCAPGLALAWFDDFNNLGDHSWGWWNGEFHETQFTFDVTDSWLNMTRVTGPDEWGNSVNLVSSLDRGYFDFELTTRVAWDPAQFQSLSIGLGSYPIAKIAIGYSQRPGTGARVFVADTGGSATVDGPASGMHEFRLTRVGATISGYLDGQLFGQIEQDFVEVMGGVVIGFTGPRFSDQNQFGGLHVDWVSIVPEPFSGITLLGALLGLTRKRMRRKKG